MTAAMKKAQARFRSQVFTAPLVLCTEDLSQFRCWMTKHFGPRPTRLSCVSHPKLASNCHAAAFATRLFGESSTGLITGAATKLPATLYLSARPARTKPANRGADPGRLPDRSVSRGDRRPILQYAPARWDCYRVNATGSR